MAGDALSSGHRNPAVSAGGVQVELLVCTSEARTPACQGRQATGRQVAEVKRYLETDRRAQEVRYLAAGGEKWERFKEHFRSGAPRISSSSPDGLLAGFVVTVARTDAKDLVTDYQGLPGVDGVFVEGR
ncbi:permease-like cell division protein FtsX [Actinomadura sp. NPDC048955]|uniref:permease-like cell division protein FtsX n=1 Tax=Actinomadura sp. NPDC048955 TaxID=3158228 RepID=UPI0033EC1B68